MSSEVSGKCESAVDSSSQQQQQQQQQQQETSSFQENPVSPKSTNNNTIELKCKSEPRAAIMLQAEQQISNQQADHHNNSSSGASNNGSHIGSESERRYRPQKFCAVCGDKAIACNFNAVTCESCKAFFRRNAFKEQRLKCLFENRCVIDRVTRRFCSKCRLLKCFQIGMKREWILTDEQKKIKRVKILQNRQTKATQKDNQLQQPSTTTLGSPPETSQSVQNKATKPSEDADNQQQQQDFNTTHQVTLLSSNKTNFKAGKPRDQTVLMCDASTSCPDESELPQAGTNNCPWAFQCSLRMSASSTAALQQQQQEHPVAAHYHQPSHHLAGVQEVQIPPYNPPATGAGQMSLANTCSCGCPPNSMPIPANAAYLELHAGQIVNLQQQFPNSAQTTLPESGQLHVLTAPSPPRVQVVADQFSNSHTLAAMTPVSSSSSSLLHPICGAQQVRQFHQTPNSHAITEPSASGNIKSEDKAATCGSPISRDNGEAAMASTEYLKTTAPSSSKQVEQLVAGNGAKFPSHLTELITWKGEIFCRPASGEEEVRSRIERLAFTDHERELINETVEATKFMFEQYDKPLTKHDSLTEIVQICDAALRRLIKTVKEIKGFRILTMDDQITLLKTTCFKILLLRSTFHYRDEIGGWCDLKTGRVMRIDLLRRAKKSLVFERHRDLITKLPEPLRKDRLILAIVAMTVLFDPSIQLKHSCSVHLDHLIYLRILRKYLLNTQPDPLTKYQNLIDSLALINACSEEYTVFFSKDFQPEQITPLLVEIFDISINTTNAAINSNDQ